VVERIRSLARTHPRFGYRRVGALPRRDGTPVNHERVNRLWRRNGLAVARRAAKKRGARPKQERPLPATQPDQVWTAHFLQDRTASDQKLRLLTVTDEFTRESLAISVARERGQRYCQVNTSACGRIRLAETGCAAPCAVF
jgi:putative transposase